MLDPSNINNYQYFFNLSFFKKHSCHTNIKSKKVTVSYNNIFKCPNCFSDVSTVDMFE
jgi:hypothetical protein